jgi:hypothetical protein
MKSTHTHNVTNHYVRQLIKPWHCCVLPYRMALDFNAKKLRISNLNGNKDCIRWIVIIFFMWRCDRTRVMASSFLRFLYHTQWRTTVGRTPLDEWSARRRDLYLTHNTHNTNIHAPVGFEPTISAGERPQTRAATGTGNSDKYNSKYQIL